MSFDSELVSLEPKLTRFALKLTKNKDQASDLVQETFFRALTYRDKFEMGTNLGAWCFTLMRNQFVSQFRRRGRIIQDPEDMYVASMSVLPDQLVHMEMLEFQEAFKKLPKDQREALYEIGVEGSSYDDAAELLGSHVGTIKSRVSRARSRLVKELQPEFDQDKISIGVMCHNDHQRNTHR